MTTKEKIADYPFNSDYEEKLLLDELISTPHIGKHLCVPNNEAFAYVQEKTRYSYICKQASGNTCVYSKKGFGEKLEWLEVKGGQAGVC